MGCIYSHVRSKYSPSKASMHAPLLSESKLPLSSAAKPTVLHFCRTRLALGAICTKNHRQHTLDACASRYHCRTFIPSHLRLQSFHSFDFAGCDNAASFTTPSCTCALRGRSRPWGATDVQRATEHAGAGFFDFDQSTIHVERGETDWSRKGTMKMES